MNAPVDAIPGRVIQGGEEGSCDFSAGSTAGSKYVCDMVANGVWERAQRLPEGAWWE